MSHLRTVWADSMWKTLSVLMCESAQVLATTQSFYFPLMLLRLQIYLRLYERDLPHSPSLHPPPTLECPHRFSSMLLFSQYPAGLNEQLIEQHQLQSAHHFDFVTFLLIIFFVFNPDIRSIISGHFQKKLMSHKPIFTPSVWEIKCDLFSPHMTICNVDVPT